MTFEELQAVMTEKKFSPNAKVKVHVGDMPAVEVERWMFVIDDKGQSLVLVADA